MSEENKALVAAGEPDPLALGRQPANESGNSNALYYGPGIQGRGVEPRQDEGVELVAYWRLLRRKSGTLILLAGLGLLAGVLITLPQTPVYQAKTSLELLNLNENFMNMKDVQQMGEEENGYNLLTDIQTQIKILQSDTLLDRVGREMGATGDEQASAQTPDWRRYFKLPGTTQGDARQKALKMAQKELKIKAAGQTRIIEVTVDSTDRKIAAEFANRLVQNYIEGNIESRWEMTQQTGSFLSKQLDDMRAKLERSEDELQTNARTNGLLFTDDDKTNVTGERLKELQEELSKAQGDRVQKQSRWELASTAAPETLPDVLNDQTLRQYDEKLADLKREKAELGQEYTPAYSRVKRVDAQIGAVQGNMQLQRGNILKQIKNEYDEALRREKLLQADYRNQAGVVTDQQSRAVQYNILKRGVETDRQIYESMLQKVKEASISGALRASNVRVVDQAKVPRFPDRPKLSLNALLGLLAGCFLGVAYVVTTEKADRMLQEPADVAFYLGLPELGVIPADENLKGLGHKLLPWGGRKAPETTALALNAGFADHVELVTWQKKLSLMAESFRAALTSVLFTGQNGHRPKMLVVTSANPGEGKTTVVTNLAIALAETGQRVLLMDADTRKPRIHELFDMKNDCGLTTLLQTGFNGNGARATLEKENLIRETKIPGLFVMPSGPGVAGPTNLLYSKHFPEYIRNLQEMFDMVLVDTPPMLTIPDARLLGKMASAVVLVVRAGKTTRDAAVAARMRFRDDGTHVLGTIMNDWDPKHSPGGYYGYYDGYSRYYKKYSAYGPAYGNANAAPKA